MAKNPKGFKEFCRKRLVALKRKPDLIPLIVMVIAFLYYSLNLTQVSNTTALINGPGMGLAEFATMLFSTLSLVCFLNAFPHRKKVNIPMLILMLLMVGGLIYCDMYYGGCITNATTRTENRIDRLHGISNCRCLALIVLPYPQFQITTTERHRFHLNGFLNGIFD